MTYDEDEYVTDREKKIARALAVAMHVGFVLLLVFGVAWQKRHSEPAAIVDLWSTMAPPRQEPPPVKPAPKAEPKPEPRPEPKPRPAPQPEVKPVPKPDIALREKLEKERKAKEQQELEKKKKQQELEKKKQQDLERRKEEEKQKEEVKRKLAQEAEAKRAVQEQSDMKAKLAKEQASAQSRLYDEYVRQISNKIKRNIVEPPNLQGNPQVEFEVRLLPGGEVLESSLRLRRSSGVPAYDQAVERAILKSSPLPLPPDPTLFNMFRELNLKIRPKE